jgi:hypothetical protein
MYVLRYRPRYLRASSTLSDSPTEAARLRMCCTASSSCNLTYASLRISHELWLDSEWMDRGSVRPDTPGGHSRHAIHSHASHMLLTHGADAEETSASRVCAPRVPHSTCAAWGRCGRDERESSVRSSVHALLVFRIAHALHTRVLMRYELALRAAHTPCGRRGAHTPFCIRHIPY